MANCDPEAISAFRGKQLRRLSALVTASAETGRLWYNCIPHQIRQDAGKLKVTAFGSIVRQDNLVARNGLRSSFTACHWSDLRAKNAPYPLGKKDYGDSPLTPRQLFGGASQRFFGRASKSGRENGPGLWRGDLQHPQAGWPAAPFPLCPTDDPPPLH